MIFALMTTVGLSVAALILILIRRDKLHVTHGFGWILVAIGFALLGIAPTLIDRIAVKLGVAYPPTLALTVAVSVLVVKILLMDIERSKLEIRNQRLTQRIAMLQADIEEIKESVAVSETSSSQDVGAPPAGQAASGEPQSQGSTANND